MPKKITESELEALLKLLERYPGGASLQQLLSSPEIQLPRRSLQRRLALLAEQDRIVLEGVHRARKYLLPEKKQGVEEYRIPLTPHSKKIQSLVEQPIQARTPVGYDRTFLERYRPNVTSYLSKTICDQFLALGGTNVERPAGTYAREIFNRILIDLSWNSSRLEGNTYSLLETERLLELDAAAAGKNLAETQMILNHKAAIEFLVDSADQVDIDRQTVLNVHALLSDNLLADPKACGSLRSKMIGIAKSVYHPLVVPNVIKECFEQVLHTAKAIHNPFEQAFFLMVHLPYLQPFEVVNKCVSRLVANIPLIKHNLPPLSFVDVPQKTYIDGLLAVYELNQIDLLRDVFVWAYERSCALYSATCQTLGDPDPFRLRYRAIIFEAVSVVVKKQMTKTDAVSTIKSLANQSVPEKDRAQFIEKVEIELTGLHEGNIARYRLRPSEYELWKKKWG